MTTTPRVALFARAAVSGDGTRQLTLATDLEALAEADHVAAVDHHWWPNRIRTPVADDGPHADAVDWFERFVSWADASDATLQPFFDHHVRSSALAGTDYEEYVFPVHAVAVLKGDELAEVAPRRTSAGETVGVDDVVGRLRGTDTPTAAATVQPAEGSPL